VIERVIFSYWAKSNINHRYSGFSNQETLLLSLSIAVKYAKKHFKEVFFYGDHEAISQVCDHIQFDKTFDTLERLNSQGTPTYLGSYSKILTYSMQNAPFLHLDNDIYLWDKPTDEFLTAPVAVECIEDTPEFYRGQLKKIFSNVMYGRTLTGDIADFMYKYRGFSGNTYNHGVFGGVDVEWIKRYSQDIIQLIKTPKNMSLLRYNFLDQEFNPVFEQWYSSIKMVHDGISPVTLQVKNPPRRADIVKYTHLSSANKRNPDIIRRLFERGTRELS